jgi:hypothetical protein
MTLRALSTYASQIFQVMQMKLMNNMEVFGTTIPVILAVRFPISCKPFFIREKQEF